MSLLLSYGAVALGSAVILRLACSKKNKCEHMRDTGTSQTHHHCTVKNGFVENAHTKCKKFKPESDWESGDQ